MRRFKRRAQSAVPPDQARVGLGEVPHLGPDTHDPHTRIIASHRVDKRPDARFALVGGKERMPARAVLDGQTGAAPLMGARRPAQAHMLWGPTGDRHPLTPSRLNVADSYKRPNEVSEHRRDRVSANARAYESKITPGR